MAAVAQADPGLITGNSLTSRTLTAAGADTSSIIMSNRGIAMSAPATNHATSNLRKVFWPTGETSSIDSQVCATWVDQSSGLVQEGVALRIIDGSTSTRALTVTKGVIYGIQWVFNVHIWDSSKSPAFTSIGRFDMRKVVAVNGLAPFPWRICARVLDASLTFKIWLPGRESEPSWTDPVHAATQAVPSGYLAPGLAGWYGGHIPAGGSAHYNTLGIWQWSKIL